MKKIKKLTAALAMALVVCNTVPMYAGAMTYESVSYMKGTTIDINDQTDEFLLGVFANSYSISKDIYKPYLGSYPPNIVSRVYVESGKASDLTVEIRDVDSGYSSTQSLRGYRNTLTWDNLTEGHRYEFIVYNSGSSYAELTFKLL